MMYSEWAKQHQAADWLRRYADRLASMDKVDWEGTSLELDEGFRVAAGLPFRSDPKVLADYARVQYKGLRSAEEEDF